MTDNLMLWNTVEKTPVAHTKAITGKSYQGTSPKPHYLIHKATETFGPCGIGWGFTIEDERIEEGAGGEKMHIARVKVWYEWNGKRGEVEHIGGTQFSGVRSSGKAFTDEDAPKKSVTDALIKALSMIGFAGDIFMGRYDDSKYVSELRAEERGQEQKASARKDEAARAAYTMLQNKLRSITTRAELSEWLKDPIVAELGGKLPADWAANFKKEITEHKAGLSEGFAPVSDAFPGDKQPPYVNAMMAG
jgi:hypothetical protein